MDPRPMTVPRFLTIPETARALSLHPSTIRAMIRRGELSCVRRPGLVRVPDWALDEWAQRYHSPASCASQDGESGISGGPSADEALSAARALRIVEPPSGSRTDS